MNIVSLYSPQGWQQSYPPLNTGRYGHACSSFVSGERRVRIIEHNEDKCRIDAVLLQYLLVSGGSSESEYLDSTEILDGEWRYGTPLPNPMAHLRATTIDNRVFLFGIN